MTPRLTPTTEQQQILDREKAPILFVDDQGCTTHLVLPIDDARRLFDDLVRRELQPAFEQAERGEVGLLDIESTIATARRNYLERKAD